MTQTTNLSKELINKSIDNENRRKFTLNNGKKNQSNYLLLDEIVDYKGIKLKAVTCYSEELLAKHKEVNLITKYILKYDLEELKDVISNIRSPKIK